MRNKYFAQFTGSKVTHLPIGERYLACGRDGRGAIWEGGYYETLPEITCKSCLRYIPKNVTYNTTTAQYVNAPGKPYGGVKSSYGSTTKEVIGDADIQRVHWFPSKDGDPAGILIVWQDGFWAGEEPRIWVYTNSQ